MRNLNKILILMIIMILSSCGEKELEFDKSKWNKRVDGFYEYRESMIEDLIQNYLNKGMTYKQVIELIGEPENFANIENNTIGFMLMENYGMNIDPIETKVLKIEFTKDSLVDNYRIEHKR